MSSLRQITAVTGMNMRSIPQRLSTSLVIVIGIAGVVAVLVSVLAMSTGMLKTMRGTGRDDRAIVVRTGAANEFSSSLTRDAVSAIADSPGVKRTADGKAIYSAETMSLILLTKNDGSEVSVPLRGVGESNGDTHESELLTHNVTLQTAMRRGGGGAQAVTAMLTSPESFGTFK